MKTPKSANTQNIPSTEFEIFPWHKNFNTGIELIDQQHKKLVEILNLLAVNLANRSRRIVLNEIFDELAAYADFHFKSEEKIWSKYFQGDIWYESHEKTHETFIKQVLELKKQEDKLHIDQVIQNIVSFLTQWLTYHILDTDKRMSIAVSEIKKGNSIADAKKISDEKMSGSMQVLINTILKMYDSLSNRTMGFLRERALRLQAESKLLQSEERWKFALEGGIEGVWDWSISDNTISQSNESEHLFDRMSETIDSKYSASNIHPDDLEQVKNDFQQHLAGESEFYINKHRVLRNEVCYWVLSRGKVVKRDEKGNALRMIGVNQDITEHQLASVIYKKSSQGMILVAPNNTIVSVNPAFSDITGYSDMEVIGQNPKSFLTNEKDELFYLKIWDLLKQQDSWEGIIWNQKKSGEKFPQAMEISKISDTDENLNYYLILISDITEKIKSDEKIFKQANYDYLTQLPNRFLFEQTLKQQIFSSNKKNEKFALLFIDLDNFKDINDIKGHNLGDLLLIEVSERIVRCIEYKNNIARFSGDEFTVILPENETQQAEYQIKKILSCLSEPFEIENEQVFITASIGVAMFPNDGDNIISLLKHADQAMFTAKESGKNCYSYFTHSMQLEATQRQQIAADLRSAINHNQLEVYFQPIVDRRTEKVCKAEALLRWNHPEKGLIEPSQFIHIAEDTGLIIEIGDWIFKEVTKKLKHWVHRFTPDFQVSINKSPKQFLSRSDPADWLKRLENFGLSGRNIALEITEGLILENNDNILQKLLMFRDAGIDISIDDFGTGYSALSYLQKFDIDYLKIDKSFINNITRESSDLSLTEAIIVMAHKLGIKVIAEGVETEAQKIILNNSGCDYIQGFLYSKPMTAEDFEDYLEIHHC